MAKAKVVGLDMFLDDISKMGNGFEEVAGRAIYEGARILADEVRVEMSGIPLDDGNAYGTERHKMRGLKYPQKKGLLDSFGIAKMQKNGNVYDVKMGFDGYNSVSTSKYPYGQPNALIARALESGTSFRAKIPFLTRAYNRAKKYSEEEMKTVFENYFDL